MTVAGQLAEYLACVEMTMVADHRDLRPFLPVAKDLDIVLGLRGSAVGLDIINTSAALACVGATRSRITMICDLTCGPRLRGCDTEKQWLIIVINY